MGAVPAWADGPAPGPAPQAKSGPAQTGKGGPTGSDHRGADRALVGSTVPLFPLGLPLLLGRLLGCFLLLLLGISRFRHTTELLSNPQDSRKMRPKETINHILTRQSNRNRDQGADPRVPCAGPGRPGLGIDATPGVLPPGASGLRGAILLVGTEDPTAEGKSCERRPNLLY